MFEQTQDTHQSSDGEMLVGNSLPISLSPLVEKARRSGITDFAGVWRKTPAGVSATIPYAAHLGEVAALLTAAGYRDEVAAAGHLHDHLEDLPQLWNLPRLTAEFGAEVAELVDWVTQQDKTLPWDVRGQLYLDRLVLAPDEAVAISVADKISNIRSCSALMRAGYPLTAVLKRGWDENTVKFHKLYELAQGRVEEGLLSILRDELTEFDRLGAPA